MNIHATEDLLVSVLLQLILIVAVARLAGTLARKFGQPRAVGEIIAGLMLGPSLFGYFLPDLSIAIFTPSAAVPMQILSQLGLIFLMFQIGSDFDFSHLKSATNKKAVTLITLASIGVPLLIGFALAQVSHDSLAADKSAMLYAGFVSIALAITAVPILGRILREYGLEQHPLGVVAISAAAMNDVIGWILLASVAALATSNFSLEHLTYQLMGLALLGLLLWFAGSKLVVQMLKRYPIVDGQLNPMVMACVFVMIFACGIATEKLGIFTIFGGFLCGLLFHQHIDFVEAWRKQIGQFVLVFFLPIFFTYTGLRTNILGLSSLNDWAWCAIFIFAAVAAKIIPVYFAARVSGFERPASTLLGVLMNTRALMELIVLNVGFNLGFIPQKVFTMLVLMAVTTTIMTGPLLKLLLPKIGLKVQNLQDA